MSESQRSEILISNHISLEIAAFTSVSAESSLNYSWTKCFYSWVWTQLKLH